MNTRTMFKLSDAQLESIVGGSYFTWSCYNHNFNGNGGGGGNSSSGPKNVHFGDSSNTGLIYLHNIYIGDNSNLIINFNQSAF